MKKKYAIILASKLLVSFILAGCMGAKNIEKTVHSQDSIFQYFASLSVSIEGPSSFGSILDLNIEVTSESSASEKMTVELDVPEGIVVVDRVTSWSREIDKKHPVEIHTQIQVENEGNKTLGIWAGPEQTPHFDRANIFFISKCNKVKIVDSPVSDSNQIQLETANP